MKIAVLSNSQMAVPALAMLAQQQSIAALGISGTMQNPDTDLPALATHFKIPVTEFSQKEFGSQVILWLEKNQADLLLVLAFPYKIPAAALSIPQLGCYNFHFALLPEFRGPQPIFWEIKTGQSHGGITVHQMEPTLDTGPIVLRHEIPIGPISSYGQHTAQLTQLCVQTMQQFIALIQTHGKQIPATPQDENKAHYWPRPQLTDLVIIWHKMSSHEIVALVNATNAWNRGAYTRLRQQTLKLVQASPVDKATPPNTKPGTIVQINSSDEGVIIACANGLCLRADILLVDEAFITASLFATHIGLNEGEQFEELGTH